MPNEKKHAELRVQGPVFNDGGQAFPSVSVYFDDGPVLRAPVRGMTLRDYFAAKCLGSGMAEWDDSEEAALYAYDVADQMLKVRALPREQIAKRIKELADARAEEDGR